MEATMSKMITILVLHRDESGNTWVGCFDGTLNEDQKRQIFKTLKPKGDDELSCVEVVDFSTVSKILLQRTESGEVYFEDPDQSDVSGDGGGWS
jgi:hypothetical protein